MKLYHPCKKIDPAQVAEMEKRALTDEKYLMSLVDEGYVLPLDLQIKLLGLPLKAIESYIKNNKFDADAEVVMCKTCSDDLIEEYISKHAVLLGWTLVSQKFVLALFDLPKPSAKAHLEHCIREGVYFSPEAQVRMVGAEFGQDLLLRYLVPYSKYARRIREDQKDPLPLCPEAQMEIFRLPNARSVIWFLVQTWELCPEAEKKAVEKAWI